MNKKLVMGLLIAVTLMVTTWVHADYPPYHNYVNDYTGTLSEQTINDLNQRLNEYDQQTGNQIAVAMIASTGDESIEDYAAHLFAQWQPGDKQKDTGVLFLIAKNDHHMRIEVGLGLEGDLTDVQAKHILDERVTPNFKAGDFNAGVANGVDKILTTLQHVPGAKPPAPVAETPDPSGKYLLLLALVLLFGFIGFVIWLGENDGGGFGSGDGSGSGGGFLTGITSYSSSDDSDSSDSKSSGSGSSFGGFGGGSSSGGGASGGW